MKPHLDDLTRVCEFGGAGSGIVSKGIQNIFDEFGVRFDQKNFTLVEKMSMNNR